MVRGLQRPQTTVYIWWLGFKDTGSKEPSSTSCQALLAVTTGAESWRMATDNGGCLVLVHILHCEPADEALLVQVHLWRLEGSALISCSFLIILVTTSLFVY